MHRSSSAEKIDTENNNNNRDKRLRRQKVFDDDYVSLNCKK